MTTAHTTLSAKEAAEQLGISLATLYAYVSRGLIHSVPGSDDSRQRRYSAADVEALLKRKAARKDPTSAAEGALQWGAPVLESALTLIEDGRLYYRGLDAVELSQSESLEAVAALLWTGTLDGLPFTPENRVTVSLPDLPGLAPLGSMTVGLALAAAADLRAYDLRPESMMNAGVRIVRLLAEAVTLHPAQQGGVTSQLAAAWIPDDSDGARLLNQALVLCADHELNASSFTARVVAAAGATLYAVVSAGLAALSGVKHGGVTGRVEAFFREVELLGDAREAVIQRLQRGEDIPGFGHRLYPEGDPRGAALVQQALAHSQPDAAALIEATLDAGYAAVGSAPTVDFGLCALARALNLPEGAPLILFALGRSVGWIGHAIEQSSDPALIRPRARYTGVLP